MSACPQASNPASGWQAGFLSVLPAVRTHAQIRFRRLPAERRADAVQEAVAAACVSYQRLAARGRLHAARPGMLAEFAVKHVRNGRHVGGRQDAARDAMSPAAQARHGFRTGGYDDQVGGHGGDWREAAVADRRTPVPDLAAFRIDFAGWLRTLAPRDRRVVAAFLRGDGTAAVAGRLGVSPGRVSHLRRRYEQSWRAFQGEGAADPAGAA